MSNNTNDSWIIDNSTVVPEDNGQVSLKITLPSGRDLTSEIMDRDQVNKLMIKWCSAVRDNIAADAAEAAAVQARGAEFTAPPGAALGHKKAATPASPREWVSSGWEAAVQRLDLAAAEHDAAEASADEWYALAKALGIESIAESDEHDESDTESEGNPVEVDGTGIDSSSTDVVRNRGSE